MQGEQERSIFIRDELVKFPHDSSWSIEELEKNGADGIISAIKQMESLFICKTGIEMMKIK